MNSEKETERSLVLEGSVIFTGFFGFPKEIVMGSFKTAVFVLALFCCPKGYFFAVGIAFVFWIGYPISFSAMFYEDMARLLLAPFRPKNHPSTLLARLRWSFTPFMVLYQILDEWKSVPSWMKAELGFFFIEDQESFAEFCFDGEEDNQLWDADYLELFRGVFTSGTLSQFIQAVRMHESVAFACLNEDTRISGKFDFSRRVSYFLNSYRMGTHEENLRKYYPIEMQLKVLFELASKLKALPVQSNGKYWLDATIRQLRNENEVIQGSITSC